MASKLVSEESSIALEKHEEEKETAVSWSDLEENIIYKITAIEKRISVYGECYLLTLTKKTGEEVAVFAPRSLIQVFGKKVSRLLLLI